MSSNDQDMQRSSKLVNYINPSIRKLASSAMSNTYVKRTTLFKVPEEHIDVVLKQYEILRKTAVKVSTGE